MIKKDGTAEDRHHVCSNGRTAALRHFGLAHVKTEVRTMDCPRCGKRVSSPRKLCPQCGLDLAVLGSLDELRNAVQSARNDTYAVARRLAELEQHITSLEPQIVTQLTSAPAPLPPPEQLPPSAEELSASAVPAVPIASQTAEESRLPSVPPAAAPSTVPPSAERSSLPSGIAELRIGQKWLLIAGVVITVLAVGYFLKYAFDRNWIGPAGRVSLAYLAGIATLSVGEFCRRKKLELFGLYLFGGGIAVLYFASYAAFQIYYLIGQLTAFGLMALVTVFAGVLALFYDTKWLAVLGIIGGFLTPVVLSTGTDNQIALMTYMAILNGGVLCIAAFQRWHLLNYLGLAFTWFLFIAWYVRHYADPKFWTTTVFLNLFFLVYALVPFAYYFARKSQQQVTGFGITVPNAFVAFGFSFLTIRGHFSLQMVSVVSVVYAAIFLGMAAYLRRCNRENLEAFVLLLAKGLLFLVLTVPILFSEHWITVFWAVQGVVLMWAALRLNDTRLRYGAVVLVLVAAAKLLFYDYAIVFELRVREMFYRNGFATSMVERWVAIMVTLSVLFQSARMLKASGFDKGSWRENLSAMFWGLFGILLFLAANIEVAAYFHDAVPRARFASISALWAVFASGLMVLGFVKHTALLRYCSMGLFIATIIKAFLRDMENVDTPFRILSFLVLGLLLVGASYLYHRYKDRILPAEEEATQT
ncbi:MAG: DUF2339 domain-containing protein [bacterium]|nr:DUF2339 domain-containing protein [bacterium]